MKEEGSLYHFHAKNQKLTTLILSMKISYFSLNKTDNYCTFFSGRTYMVLGLEWWVAVINKFRYQKCLFNVTEEFDQFSRTEKRTSRVTLGLRDPLGFFENVPIDMS